MPSSDKNPNRMERDELVEAVLMLRYERRLLGAARMTLDLVAAGDVNRWDSLRKEAGDVAQMIVDEIGHPVTDEPALGPEIRDLLATAAELLRDYEDNDECQFDHYGNCQAHGSIRGTCRNAQIKDLLDQVATVTRPNPSDGPS